MLNIEKPFQIKSNNENYRFDLFQTKFLSNGKNDFAVASGFLDIFKKYSLDQVVEAHNDLEGRKIIGPAIIVPS